MGMEVGTRIPDVVLEGVGVEARVPVRAEGRLATVLLAMHADCAACTSYVEELASHAQEMREWDGRVVAIFGERSPGETTKLPEGESIRFATDPQGKLRDAGIVAPAVVIADQWGEVFAAEEAGADHAFLPPHEVIAWLRHLATRCPECEGEAL